MPGPPSEHDEISPLGSARALVNDAYVNLKLLLKLDVPEQRETLLDLFDRVKRFDKSMDQFKRYEDELALETAPTVQPYRWLAIRQRNIRCGVVNPETPAQATALHRHLLEVAPFYLSISPLDVECVEVLFGLDLAAPGNHDQIVFDALHAGPRSGPLAALLDAERVIDCQPMVGFECRPEDDGPPIEAHVEVKTRSRAPRRGEDVPGPEPSGSTEPISVYLIVRHTSGITDVSTLPAVYDRLVRAGAELLDDRVLPRIIVPLREEIPPA
ncbi:MAG: hypothetical protein AAF108_04465 [Planctomycetota bacterium]